MLLERKERSARDQDSETFSLKLLTISKANSFVLRISGYLPYPLKSFLCFLPRALREDVKALSVSIFHQFLAERRQEQEFQGIISFPPLLHYPSSFLSLRGDKFRHSFATTPRKTERIKAGNKYSQQAARASSHTHTMESKVRYEFSYVLCVIRRGKARLVRVD